MYIVSEAIEIGYSCYSTVFPVAFSKKRLDVYGFPQIFMSNELHQKLHFTDFLMIQTSHFQDFKLETSSAVSRDTIHCAT